MEEVVERVNLRIGDPSLIGPHDDRKMNQDQQTVDIQGLVRSACRDELQIGFEKNIPKLVESVSASIKQEIQNLPRGDTVRAS